MADRIDSRQKGNRVERDLCKILAERLGGSFSRTVGSGNRWSQAEMNRSAAGVFSGDICVPDDFRWTIECKGGYVDALNPLPGGRSVTIDGFIAQATSDAERCGRLPMVAWKRDRRPWLVMVRVADLSDGGFDSVLTYRGWAILTLSDLIDGRGRSFWFSGA